MQRAPPSRIKRPKPYARPAASSSQPRVQGSFHKARNFTIQTATFNDTSYQLEIFMEKFAKKTIPGAAFDSSERDPPPRCHPGTRLAIVERTLHFFADQERSKKLLWVIGPAGVGKSAIMQTLAETPSTPDFTLGASLFFSINGRDDGSKTMVTLAYQLAVRSKPYRYFVQSELAKDPTLLDKALTPQFNKLIVEPFVTQGISPKGHERFLIFIDGLDECSSQDTQCTILDLISSFCIKYPTAPLVWVIASRPEPHITRFLSRPNVASSYVKEEIEVDSNQSRADVERYLRNGLEIIRTKYPALDHFPCWPVGHDFLKLATAAGGLFAFGKAVMDYIDDPTYANPVSQLEEVLEVIREVRSQGKEKRHPMADLDALYSHIISKIPQSTLIDTKKLLLQILSPSLETESIPMNSLKFACNWLGMTAAAAYGALHHLHSVLYIPMNEAASIRRLEFRHKSFRDYLADFERSGMFLDLKEEARELNIQCVTRTFGEVSKAREIGLDPYDGVSLSWPSNHLRLQKEIHYGVACCFIFHYFTTLEIEDTRCDPRIASALKDFDPTLGTEQLRLRYPDEFPWVSKVILSDYIRPQLKDLDVFQEMSIRRLDMDRILRDKGMIIFYHTKHQNTVSPFQDCTHGMSTQTKDTTPQCSDGGCCWRYKHCSRWESDCDCYALWELDVRKTYSPDDIVTTFTGTGKHGWIYHTFPDSKDASSTWTYIVPYQFKPT